MRWTKDHVMVIPHFPIVDVGKYGINPDAFVLVRGDSNLDLDALARRLQPSCLREPVIFEGRVRRIGLYYNVEYPVDNPTLPIIRRANGVEITDEEDPRQLLNDRERDSGAMTISVKQSGGG